jgi:thymidylate synthase (FAD)
MQVNIISKLPDNPINYIAENARICYGRESFNENLDFNNNKDLTTVESLLNKGHHSVFECIYIEWYVRNISRAATHQIVRHRMASYLQQSQRYCKYDYESSDGFWENMVIPDLDYLGYEDKLHDALIELNDIINNIKNAYKELIKLGVKPEDARCILPNCSPTTIKIGMNLREFLFNFYPLRTSKHAQAEIRNLAIIMFGTLITKYISDKSFQDFIIIYTDWLSKQNRPEWK